MGNHFNRELFDEISTGVYDCMESKSCCKSNITLVWCSSGFNSPLLILSCRILTGPLFLFGSVEKPRDHVTNVNPFLHWDLICTGKIRITRFKRDILFKRIKSVEMNIFFNFFFFWKFVVYLGIVDIIWYTRYIKTDISSYIVNVNRFDLTHGIHWRLLCIKKSYMTSSGSVWHCVVQCVYILSIKSHQFNYKSRKFYRSEENRKKVK